MAIAVIDSKHFTCLSGDVKPTIATRSDVEAGDIITETDTGIDYITYDGTNWVVYEKDALSAAQINAEVDSALNTAIPAAPTALSINALVKGQLAYLAPVTSSADTTHFVSSQLIGLGNDYFVGWTAYVVWDAGGGSAAPQGEYRTITDYVSSTGTFTMGVASTQLAASDIVLLIHPVIAGLGLVGDAAAAGPVTSTDTIMAYIKQLVTNSEAVAAVLGAVDTAAATGAVTDVDLIMAYIKQLVTSILTIESIIGAPQTLSAANDTVSQGFYAATTLHAVDADLAAGNIKTGVTIFGIAGSYDTEAGNPITAAKLPTGDVGFVNGSKVTGSGTKTLSPSTTAVEAGYYAATDLVTVDADLVTANIKSGATIFGISGTSTVKDVSDTTAEASDVAAGHYFYTADGTRTEGTAGG